MSEGISRKAFGGLYADLKCAATRARVLLNRNRSSWMRDADARRYERPKGSEMFHPHLVGEMHRHDGTVQMDERAVRFEEDSIGRRRGASGRRGVCLCGFDGKGR